MARVNLCGRPLNPGSIEVERCQKACFVTRRFGTDPAESFRFNEKRNLKRPVMRPKSNPVLGGVIAPTGIWKIQCHSSGMALFDGFAWIVSGHLGEGATTTVCSAPGPDTST